MKDAKGHGSNKRGATGQKLLPSASQVPLGKLPGEEGVQAAFARVGAAGSINVINGQQKVARLAQQHGIQGGPFKVQTYDPTLVGQPFKTAKSYRNSVVAETVAKGMRTDSRHLVGRTAQPQVRLRTGR